MGGHSYMNCRSPSISVAKIRMVEDLNCICPEWRSF